MNDVLLVAAVLVGTVAWICVCVILPVYLGDKLAWWLHNRKK